MHFQESRDTRMVYLIKMRKILVKFNETSSLKLHGSYIHCRIFFSSVAQTEDRFKTAPDMTPTTSDAYHFGCASRSLFYRQGEFFREVGEYCIRACTFDTEQCFFHHAVAVQPSFETRCLDHGILPAYIVGSDGKRRVVL